MGVYTTAVGYAGGSLVHPTYTTPKTSISSILPSTKAVSVHTYSGAIVYLQGQRRCLMPKPGEKVMGKEQKSNKETKKAPAMTAKEKKAAKKAKKNERGRIGE